MENPFFTPNGTKAASSRLKISSTFRKTFFPFEVLADKFHIKRCHVLNYHSLISAIPSECKKRLFKNESNPTPALTSCILSKPFSCKTLYPELLTRQKLPRPTAEKRLEYYNFRRDDFSKIYLLKLQKKQN